MTNVPAKTSHGPTVANMPPRKRNSKRARQPRITAAMIILQHVEEESLEVEIVEIDRLSVACDVY